MYNLMLYSMTIAIWGSSWFVIKFQVGEVPAIQSVLYRFIIAAVLLLVVLKLTGHLKRQSFAAHRYFLVMGGFLFSSNYVLFYLATQYGLTTGLVAVAFSCLIVMNMVNGILLFKDRLKVSILVGAGIGLLGILALFGNELGALADGTLVGRGILLSVVGTYFASLGNMASRKLQSMRVDVMNANAWGMGYGAIFLLIAALLTTERFVFSWQADYIISLGALAIIASIVGFWAYLTLLGRIGSSRAAYCTIALPVIALMLSSIFEDYTWNGVKLAGVALVVLGNLVVLGKVMFWRRGRVKLGN